MKVVLEIEERLVRKVIVEADSRIEAYELAEDLCNDGIIDLDSKDFKERFIDFVDNYYEDDLKDCKTYRSEDYEWD
ncbi:MAG: hypothetical protein IJ643_04470 [Eubacterium sp.]|nr:hypothetical protein [Eubacterium sp.]